MKNILNYRFQCDCEAWGNSTSSEALAHLVKRHRELGHEVTVWKDGEEKKLLAPLETSSE